MRRFYKLRVFTWNTHRGLAVKSGGLRKLKRLRYFHLGFLQEADPSCHDEIRKAFPREKWLVYPYAFKAESDKVEIERYQNVIIARKRRFELVWFLNEQITTYRDSMHPRRFLPELALRDKKTGRLVLAMSVHTWALGEGWDSPRAVVDEHLRQIDAVGQEAYAFHAANPGSVVIAGGDWNQTLQARESSIRSASFRLGHDGLVSSADALGVVPPSTSLEGPSALDEVFVSDRPSLLRVLRRRVVRVGAPGEDHKAVIVTLKVRKRR